MAIRFRIYHVANDGQTLREKILFEIPTCSVNIPPSRRIDERDGIITYEQMANWVISHSDGKITDMTNMLLWMNNDNNSHTLLLKSKGFTTVFDSLNNMQVNDRIYINRWDNSHSYLLYKSKQGNQFLFDYCCSDGTVAYSNVGWTEPQDFGNYGYQYTIPWLYYWGENNNNYYITGFTLGVFDSYDAFLDCRIGSGHAPTSIDNAKTFWADSKILDNIDSKLDPLKGTPDYEGYEGDEINMPDAPDETVSGVLVSGFLNIYCPTDAQLKSFGSALWTNAFNVKWYNIDSVANLVLNTISDPINFIIGLFMLPVTPETGNASGVYLGGINVNTVSVKRVTSQFVTVDFGTIDINELYGNYLDYSYSRLSIYLPYIGMADIDVQEVTGGSVTLRYIIDAFTGACVANVKCVKITKTPWGQQYRNSTVHSYSGNVAIQLPISAGSFDVMTQGLINVGLGLISGQPQAVAKGATDVIQSVGGDATTRGSLSSNTGKLCYQTPYLMFTRPIETRPANMGNLHGYSAGVGGQLKNFSGFIECSDVKLDGVSATDSEKNMIESLLKSGVYV